MHNFPDFGEHKRGRGNPFIPKPEHKEIPDTEDLVTPKHIHHERPKVIKPYENVPEPKLNRLYGTARTEDGWQYTVDNWANGGFTTVAGAQVLTDVNFNLIGSENRLSRWPGAIAMYLCIRSFSIALSTATLATLGSLDLYYQDTIGGQTIPLCSLISNGSFQSNDMQILIPTPITDAGQINDDIGQIQANLSAGATVGTYVFQMGFSYAYLLATSKPYTIVQVEDLLDAHPGHVR
jgi:hypothetical protein